MISHRPLLERLFDDGFRLIDGTDEIFELDLALWEYESLSKRALIQRSAYFKTVNGKETVHYRACNLQNLEEVHKDSSFRTKIFFLAGKYTTGYATHGLFPYRGKFHPQLIRALLNVLRINPGQTVIDPMAGSATVAVEANLLGIDSVAVDLSPFCGLMGRVKTFALNLDDDKLESIAADPARLLAKLNKTAAPRYFAGDGDDGERGYYEVVLLAFLDAMGFANRSQSSLEKLFPRVLARYCATIAYFQRARTALKLNIGESNVLCASAMNLPLDDDSADAVITSPPYSFAIDYLKNDQPQLEYLGSNLAALRRDMVGLQGRGVDGKLTAYFEQMATALGEMSRVAKKNAPVVIIIGTNDIQTGGVNLQAKVVELAAGRNLKLNMEIIKPIRGMQNTMKSESILFFTNAKSGGRQ